MNIFSRKLLRKEKMKRKRLVKIETVMTGMTGTKEDIANIMLEEGNWIEGQNVIAPDLKIVRIETATAKVVVRTSQGKSV